MTATSGRKCYEQYGRYSPVGSLAKMLLESSRWFSPAVRLRWEAKPLCSERLTEKEYSSDSDTPSRKSVKVLNVKDTPSSRFLFRLVPSARPTAGTACGLLPTVQTQGLKRCNADGKTEFMPMELLPTPTSIDRGSGRINKSPSPNAKDRPTIALAAKMGLLPSPVASDATTGAIIGKEDKFIVTKNGTPRKVKQERRERERWIGKDGATWRTSSNSDHQRRQKLHHSRKPNETPATPRSDWEELPALRWAGFPTTQPVIRGGDDGLPARLAGITFPKWRAESIKALGNAIVPQVMYEIFRAIQQTEYEETTAQTTP